MMESDEDDSDDGRMFFDGCHWICKNDKHEWQGYKALSNGPKYQE